MNKLQENALIEGDKGTWTTIFHRWPFAHMEMWCPEISQFVSWSWLMHRINRIFPRKAAERHGVTNVYFYAFKSFIMWLIIFRRDHHTKDSPEALWNNKICRACFVYFLFKYYTNLNTRFVSKQSERMNKSFPIGWKHIKSRNLEKAKESLNLHIFPILSPPCYSKSSLYVRI